MADQCNEIRKLKVPANDASMQLSVKSHHHLRDWDQVEHDEFFVPRDSLSIWSRESENPLRGAFFELISEYPFPVVHKSVSDSLFSNSFYQKSPKSMWLKSTRHVICVITYVHLVDQNQL